MNNNQIAEILLQHSVPYYEQNGRIFADSMEAFTEIFEHVEDVTGWSIKKLYNWLGY